MTRLLLSVFVLATLAASAACADPMTSITMGGGQAVNGSDGNIYNAGVGPYYTPSATVSQAGGVVTIDLLTQFSGTESVAGFQIGYADLFFGGVGAGYGISLGHENGSVAGTPNNGGLQAGVYQVGSAATSYDIWNGRPGVIYGASYGAAHTLAPTVITGGTFLEGVSISQAASTALAGYYDLSVTFGNAPSSLVTAFENGSLSMFWGTGDCSNGAFNAVPEPATYALFGVAVLTTLVMRRRMSKEASASF